MPRQGQTVESCIIAAWKKAPGDRVTAGEVLAEVETDKAIVEVESPASGILVEILYPVGADVPVMHTIAHIAEGAAESGLIDAASTPALPQSAPTSPVVTPISTPSAFDAAFDAPSAAPHTDQAVSPRARRLAAENAVDSTVLDLGAISGTGPHGRIIERDVRAALEAMPPAPRLTPVAGAMLAAGGYAAPARGSGINGKITRRDLVPLSSAVLPAASLTKASPPAASTPATQPAAAVVDPGSDHADDDDVTMIAIKGARKIIAERMLHSMQTTAQLTLHRRADARALQAYRARLKATPEALGLRGITINDLVLFAVSRALMTHPDLNATFDGTHIRRYRRVDLGMAVDTPRGLLVPVIRDCAARSLRQISDRAKVLAAAAQSGKIAPNDLQGGTFSVTNLGGLGIDSFTPILDAPQVAILGIGGIALHPVTDEAADIAFIPHIALSLTLDHRVIDGAPGARFLITLADHLAAIDMLTAS